MAISRAEEQRRMKRHPGIVFRDGATGRRPALADGPQVWVLAELFRSEPLGSEHAIERAAQNVATFMELTHDQLRAAIRYYLEYPDEVDDWIRRNDEEADRAKAEWLRKQQLLHS
ncbi:MAG: hypothetical protein F4X26_04675 [Chloroflexi bacterium]|nr:hypothetical protein [Chloroflexota bacterium]